MLSLGRFLQHAAGEDEVDHGALVERLVQRAAEAVLLPDRRAALNELRDLLGAGGARAQAAFGAAGLPVALSVVRDREDLESVQLALEALAAAVGGGEHGGGVTQAAAVNAQQLARTPDGVPLLLNLLEAEPGGMADFYARYHALQVLKGLSAAAPLQLQEAILGAPLGVTRLMDLLGEQEVLRNEALLLLTRLAGGSPDLQKIAVFEGAFDRLFGIIREEGGMEGDIVVQDCLQLLAALLRGSPPNQLMFRETGFLAQLPTMLKLPDSDSPSGGGGRGRVALALPGSPTARRELAPQAAANLAAALEVVLVLLPPAAAPPTAPVCASAAENRAALLQRGLVEVLVALGLQGGGVSDDAVRAQALLCLAALVGGNRLQQDQLAALAVKAGGGEEQQPLLQAALAAAVDGTSAAEHTAADRLLEAYCTGNAAGQGMLAGSLLHSAGPPSAATFGGFLALRLGLQGGLRELAASARAAGALAHLVAGNPGIRPHLLAVSVPLAAGPGAAGFSTGSASLMAACTQHLAALLTQHGREAASAAAAADLLRLLLLWLHACPPAVTAFLRAVSQSQPFLVDSVRGSNACSAAAASAHPVTRGQLALLLGLCASYAEDGAGTPSQAQLLGAIGQQVGQQQYLAALDAMVQHPALAPASASSGSAPVFGDGPLPSPAFADFLRQLAAEVRQRVTGEAAPPQPQTAAGAAYTAPSPPAVSPTAYAAPAMAASQLQHPPVFQAVPPGTLHPPPPPHLPSDAAPRALPNGRAPWSGPSSRATSPQGVVPPYQHPFGGSHGSTATSPQPASPRLPPPPSGVPMFGSAGAAAAALGSPRSTPPPGASPRAAAGDAAARLQQALALVESLQRENQQLRSEAAALSERLRLGAATAGAGGLAAQAAQAEADAARQQLAAVQQQLAEAEAEAERARGDAQAAQAAARKMETDLEDLSAAYGTLDAHAGSLQQQVEQLQGEVAQQRAAAGAAAAEQQPQPGAAAAVPGGVSEEEVERRVAAARAEGAAEAQEEADEAMTDLLVCLGQEEAKVARLCERLRELGVDAGALLADILAAGEAGEGAGHEDDVDLT